MKTPPSIRPALVGLSVAAAAVLAAPTAHAYITAGDISNFDWNAMSLAQQPLKRAQEHERQIKKERRKAAQAKRNASGNNRASNQNMSKNTQTSQALDARVAEYRASSTLSAKIHQQIIDAVVANGKKNGSLDANAEQQLRDALAGIELASITKAMQSQGLPPNNLASAAAYWLIANYEIIRDEEISQAQTRAVFEQMQQRLAADPDNARLADADKQQTAESMIWVATLQYMHYMEARNNTTDSDMRAVKTDARQSLQQYGINADRMQLTAQGLVSP